mgnify:CR=1 FL=1
MASVADVHRLLAENEAARRRARAHDEALRRAMESELARVDARLMSLPAGRVAGSSASAFEYRRLQEDRARLLRQVAGF